MSQSSFVVVILVIIVLIGRTIGAGITGAGIPEAAVVAIDCARTSLDSVTITNTCSTFRAEGGELLGGRGRGGAHSLLHPSHTIARMRNSGTTLKI